MDVKIAFINGPLKEEQAPRAWYNELSTIPISKGFTKGKDWKDKKKQKQSKTDKKREKDKETKSKSEKSARDHSRISPTQSKIEIKKVKESR
ncbi:hypothetical protein Tco_1290259 [Tanacetum coccineum]